MAVVATAAAASAVAVAVASVTVVGTRLDASTVADNCAVRDARGTVHVSTARVRTPMRRVVMATAMAADGSRAEHGSTRSKQSRGSPWAAALCSSEML